MFVNRAKRSAAVSHATLINTVLEKVREVKQYDEELHAATRLVTAFEIRA